MTDLEQKVADAVVKEAGLEARVTAHENNDAANVIALQAQIDALSANGDPAVKAAVASLQALNDRMDAFDTDAVALNASKAAKAKQKP